MYKIRITSTDHANAKPPVVSFYSKSYQLIHPAELMADRLSYICRDQNNKKKYEVEAEVVTA